MTLQDDFDKGHQGAKRSSWKKLHFRDLALKICEQHRDADVEELAQLFMAELEQYPGYMESIAVYIMANIKVSLSNRTLGGKRSLAANDAIHKIVTRTAARVLMQLQMPNGKTLAQSTGAECKKAGGWLVAVGEKVGDRNIVSTKLTEADLHKLLKK